ncbi:MAG: Eco57I restriction-modification methylase domain-containing protein, partial [Methanobrevibacter sp.]|jgi:Alw26I/Eco31I/Esp3I family type II restriction m6 adenine DNA methyltransferase|nr:Eco57I restriction-modification methylase domain-containing protein [Candidatus Methanoflexus mossambicus]
MSNSIDIITILNDIQMEILEKMIKDEIKTKNLSENEINLLLNRSDSKNLVLKVHENIIYTILYYFLDQWNFDFNLCYKFFNNLSNNKLSSKYNEIISKMDKLEFKDISILEQLHISFLNSQYIFEDSKVKIKKSKINLRERGAVYTPKNIVCEMVINTINNQLNNGVSLTNLQIMDFGCGTGRFYIEAFNYLLSLGLNEKEIIINNLFGIDIDHLAIDILKIKVLNQLEDPNIDDLENLSNNIVCKNMLINSKERLNNDGIDYNDEFPNVMKNGGFNVILSNPPYFLLKINKKTNNLQFNEHLDFLSNKLKNEISYFRNSGSYNFSIEGMLNYYKLSIEQMINISTNGAELGIICPSTLFADLSSKKLRKFLIEKNKIRKIKYFSESSKLFNNVSQATVIFYLKKSANTKDIEININENFIVPLELIKKFNEFYEIPYISKIGWNILDKLSKFPKLKEIKEIRNKRGEFDLTFYKDCIIKKDTGWRLVRGNMIKNGKIIDKNDEFVDVEKFKKSKSLEYLENDFNKKRLVCQQIVNKSILKRLNFVYCEKTDILGNSCNYINANRILLDFLSLLLNSYLLNWRFNITSSNNHVNNYELNELPICITNKINFDNLNELERNIKICEIYKLNKEETNYILKDFFLEDEINSSWRNIIENI